MGEPEIRKIIRETVLTTVKELQQRRVNFENEEMIYRTTGDKLTAYFAAVSDDEELEEALEQVKGDRYFSILTDYYGRFMSIADISRKLNVDKRTVHRNKKRLCLQLFKIMEEPNHR